jgi:hypothetical protein
MHCDMNTCVEKSTSIVYVNAIFGVCLSMSYWFVNCLYFFGFEFCFCEVQICQMLTPDTSAQEPLLVENNPDPLAGEQVELSPLI